MHIYIIVILLIIADYSCLDRTIYSAVAATCKFAARFC